VIYGRAHVLGIKPQQRLPWRTLFFSTLKKSYSNFHATTNDDATFLAEASDMLKVSLFTLSDPEDEIGEIKIFHMSSSGVYCERAAML
jgi:hypothetical protein